MLVVADMKIEHEIADARTEVMQIAPDDGQQHQLEQGMRYPGRQARKGFRRLDATPEERHDDQGKTEEKQRTARAMQNRRLRRKRQAVQVNEKLRHSKISVLWAPLGSCFGHGGLGLIAEKQGIAKRNRHFRRFAPPASNRRADCISSNCFYSGTFL